jgi:cytochrome c-type biogenesis protein CcmH/NrfG
LQAFDRAVSNAPSRPGIGGNNTFFANVAHGRAMAWNARGDVRRAIPFAEETTRLRPERAQDWLELAELYDREQRFEDAKQARERAAAINGAQKPSRGGPWEQR